MTTSAATVLELRDRVRRHETTAQSAVADALRQIDAVDGAIAAVGQVFRDEALAAAAAIDRRLASGDAVGPLAGVPFTVKENIATVEGTTSASSRILEQHRSVYDATAVARLRRAGAVLVAKTNMDEFGMGSSTENSAFHVTRNPWRPTHVPGGSSGGAAALSAATRGMIHLGSDTGGSIRQPASYCGVTGFKPTYGRVSRYGLLAFASSLDQIGALQQSAADCALALGAIAGEDAMDATSRDAEVPDFVALLARGVEGLRIGVPREFFPGGVDAEVRELVEVAVAKLEGLGAEVREVSLPHVRYANPAYVLVSAAEASSNLARYDGIHCGRRVADPADLIDLYARSRAEGFGAEVKRRILIGTFVLSSGYYDAFYRKALQVRSLVRRDFERVFADVDAVVGPTSPVPAFPIGERMDDPMKLYAVDVLTVPANLAGLPAISLPCGSTRDGLPIGLQVHGRALEDDVVLRLAAAYQSSTDHHARAPSICAWRSDAAAGSSGTARGRS